MARNPLQTGDDSGNPLSLAPWQVGDPTDPMAVANAQTGVAGVDALTRWLAEQRAKSEQTRPIWNPNNAIGTSTLQSMGMPAAATTHAGPVGQFIDPSTGRLTTQGAGRFDNPALGIDTGGVGMIKAYHGSPHQFDAFDMSKIGTGEGAQAYGHGMYLAENEGVARGYRDTLAGKNQKLEWNGQPVEGRAVNSLVDSLQDQDWRLARIVDQAGKWGPRNAIDTFEPHTRNASDGPAWQAAMDQFKEGVGNSATGHMYEVNVNADPERFLHWDKPLSEQHPDVIKALNNTPYPPRDMRMSVKDYMAELETNREMASKMGDPAAMASQALQEAGIPGIRYLDQGSRGAGEGSHNYVVFDANSMDIIRRYGLAGLMAGASGYGASLSGRSSEAATQQRQPNALQAP